MQRRDVLGVLGIPCGLPVLTFLNARSSTVHATEDVDLVQHCRRILEQNLLKTGERLVVASNHQYDREFSRALLLAGSEIGASGAHLVVIPKTVEEVWFSKSAGATRGLTPWHWDLYASADLLIHVSPNAGTRERPKVRYRVGAFPVMTSYESKIGNHPYRTDFELINREGSKTRWLKIGLPLDRQIKYFPNKERTELTLKGAEIVHTAREIRVTGSAGSDFVVRKEGRPGHAQYGIADVPGRYDNFGFGSVACSPQEYTAEGVVVLEPGDTFQSYPATVPTRDTAVAESVRITFEGGYVIKVEGGESAGRFEALLRSYNNKESSGISHIGFGTQEKTEIDDLGFYSSNGMGVITFSLGANYGHGLGGESLEYSGFGATARKAPSHTNFSVFGQDFICDGQKLIEKGRLLLA